MTKKIKPAAKIRAAENTKTSAKSPVVEGTIAVSKQADVDLQMEAALVKRLVKAREKNGLTQEQLAALAGMKQSAVARLESLGARPRIDTMIKLLKPLGYTLAVVLLGEEKEVVKRKPENLEEKPVIKQAAPVVEKQPEPQSQQQRSVPGHKGIQLPRR